MIIPRHRVLPSRGALLVSTDLHGNLGDLHALAQRFHHALGQGLDVHWALLGDFVHGPTPDDAARDPELYGYPDESPALLDALTELRAMHPSRVHVVLGNHDAGHLGFARTSKFHPDEVAALEARLTPAQQHRLRDLFSTALLALVAPCGLMLSHGAPGEALTSLALLDGPLSPLSGGADAKPAWDVARARAMNELLWSYGQTAEVAARMLARISAETGRDLRVLVHGHDRDPSGWFVEGGNQVQPVMFGALRENKRYLWLDLAARYESAQALREGHEVRRLY